MMQRLELLSAAALFLFFGTGLFSQVPSIAYVFVAGSIALLLFDKRFLLNSLRYIEPNMLKGILLFNTFLWCQIVASYLDLDLYFIQMVSINLMALIYVYLKLILDDGSEPSLKNYRFIAMLLLAGLLIILLAQFGQINGYIELENLEGRDQDFLLTKGRPGGFLNPNFAAGIAVMILYTLWRMSKVVGNIFLVIGLPIGVEVILLAQSRAATIAMLILAGMMLAKNSLRNVISILLIVIVSVSVLGVVFQDELSALVDNAAARFEGDASSDDRKDALEYSFHAIGESPIVGNGSRYLVQKLGFSSHNQLAEILVAYGFVGLLVMLGVVSLLYLPVTSGFAVCCILPTFLFSHNFFDSYSYQIVLGMTLAICRKIEAEVKTDFSVLGSRPHPVC